MFFWIANPDCIKFRIKPTHWPLLTCPNDWSGGNPEQLVVSGGQPNSSVGTPLQSSGSFGFQSQP
ncbi:MAG: hypothetical protein B6D61_12045 [Bacteroidetes bacterium 4484_249]|nr:MAG: hypothetical protein B6D61_12045 [Bacteroidetes bacterium 4484_249]